jgi:cadmium resistance protein CadD (predicted permease)
MEIILILFVAALAFLATNLDDIFILMSFFAITEYNKFTVVLGQYLGLSLLLIISYLASLFKLIIPQEYIALFGIIPLIIGFKYLWNLKGDIHKSKSVLKTFRSKYYEEVNYNQEFVSNDLKKIFKISALTFFNGGDNLGVYIPLFMSMDIFQIGITSLIFLLLMGIWCILGYLLINNKIFGNKIVIYGHLILPLVLIFIGLGIILKNGINFAF